MISCSARAPDARFEEARIYVPKPKEKQSHQLLSIHKQRVDKALHGLFGNNSVNHHVGCVNHHVGCVNHHIRCVNNHVRCVNHHQPSCWVCQLSLNHPELHKLFQMFSSMKKKVLTITISTLSQLDLPFANSTMLGYVTLPTKGIVISHNFSDYSAYSHNFSACSFTIKCQKYYIKMTSS